MKTLYRLIVGAFLAMCLAGCGDGTTPKAVDSGKPAEVAKPQQSVDQVVEQAASQGATSAGRKAQNSIDNINAQKKSDE